MSRANVIRLLAILAVALNLRGAITCVGPLLEHIQARFGLNATAAGLLTSLPLFAFALLSPYAAPVARRLGMEQAVFVSLLLLLAAFGLFTWARGQGADLAAARTVAISALVAGEIGYLVSSRRITSSALSWEGLFGSRPVLISIAAVVLLQLAFTYLPWLQFLFDTQPIGGQAWMMIGLAGIIVLAAVEAEKRLLRQAHRLRPA